MCSNSNDIYIFKDFYYTFFKIKNRVIFVPCDKLKSAQKYFLNAVRWIYPLKTDALKCAKMHTGKKWVLKMDIKDFYSSVPPKDILRVVSNVCNKIKNKKVLYQFKLVTLDGKLPTGASTSAHIANACYIKVEQDIRDYCNILGVDFTRYVDDLVFSSDEKQLLRMVEKRVSLILNFYGYKLNKSKTKYISDNKQQNVLGLVVNYNKVRLSKNYKKQIRAKLHNYVVSLSKSENNTNDIKYLKWSEKDCNSLKGTLTYIKHVEPQTYEKFKNYYFKLLKKMCVKNQDDSLFIKKPTFI